MRRGSSTQDTLQFEDEHALTEHFENHRTELAILSVFTLIVDKLGVQEWDEGVYLKLANWVVENGSPVKDDGRPGRAYQVGNQYLYVGLNASSTKILTFHLKNRIKLG
jgi:hypothetical protein